MSGNDRTGVCELKVEQKGFKTAEIPQFKVDIRQTVRLDVPLEVGRVEEMVTVSSRSTLSFDGRDKLFFMRQIQLGLKYSF